MKRYFENINLDKILLDIFQDLTVSTSKPTCLVHFSSFVLFFLVVLIFVILRYSNVKQSSVKRIQNISIFVEINLKS